MGERKAPWGRGVLGKHAGCPQLGLWRLWGWLRGGVQFGGRVRPLGKAAPLPGVVLARAAGAQGRGALVADTCRCEVRMRTHVCILYVLCED